MALTLANGKDKLRVSSCFYSAHDTRGRSEGGFILILAVGECTQGKFSCLFFCQIWRLNAPLCLASALDQLA